MDADDWLDPECFKTIMEYRELESVDIVSWNYYLKEEGCSTKASAIRPERFVETVDEALIRVNFILWVCREAGKKARFNEDVVDADVPYFCDKGIEIL